MHPTNDPIDNIKEIQDYINSLFQNPFFRNNGFFQEDTFKAAPTCHPIFLLGTNPGIDPSVEKVMFNKEDELIKFQNNVDYNELLIEKYKIIQGLQKLYGFAFGEENVNTYLKNTFAWNLCVFANEIKWSQLGEQIKEESFRLCFDLFSDLVTLVQPRIILTFVEPINFIAKKIRNPISKPIKPNDKMPSYYYALQNAAISGHFVKIVGIHHLSRSYWNNETWEAFGIQFGKDCNNLSIP